MADQPEIIDPHGHLADAPSEMPKAAWKQILARTYKRTWDDNVGLVAAGVAFYGFFALLSLLGLIVLVYGFFADRGNVVEHMRVLTAILPNDVATLIGDQLMTAVRSSEGIKGLGILLAIVVALYGGSNGAAAVITALNIAYEEKDTRSLLRFYVLAVSMTVIAVVVALVALAGTAALALLQEILPQASPALITVGEVGGYVLLAFIAAGIASVLYRFGPARENAKWRWITPGSLFSAISWLILTALFGVYLSYFTDYDASYGSLAAAVALLTWMYFCAYAFVFGAELNSEIEHQTAKDSTTGLPKPLGERGAWAADNVATDETAQDRPEEVREGERLTQASPTIAEKEN
ncbi:YihY/virulence factor BrkB family protein [Sphingomonas limnosediminicola]|uniref:YihY/virulence factor BrkB family protein n=1 Tax=Sphingomonas limnosediminicola TaxID=940133 RepID=A0ABP7KSJ6_9SPHN